MPADKDSAEIEKSLDKLSAEDGGEKILNQKKQKPVDVRIVYDTPNIKGKELKRLTNEANLFWKVYFKREKKEGLKEEKKARGKDSGKDSDKKGVANKVADEVKDSGDINKNKVEAEASIFWEVYYKIKSQKDPKKDEKGKTKITPVTKAIDEVQGEKEPKPKKKGKGFIGWLMGLFAPFVALLAPILGKGGFLALLGIAFKSVLAAIAPLIITGAGLFALGAAVVLAVNKIKGAVNAWKDMKKELKESREITQHIKEQGKVTMDIFKAREKKAKELGLKDQERLAQLEQENLKNVEAWSKLSSRQKDKQRDDHLDKQEKIYAEKKGIKAKLDMQRAAGDLSGGYAEELVSMDEFNLLSQKQKGTGLWHPDPGRRAHNVAMRREAGLPEVKTMYSHPKWYAAEEKKKEAIKQKAREALLKKMRRGGAGSSAYGYIPMGDFISRPGMPPVSFDSKDDILGFKQGGPVSKLLRDQVGKFQLSEIKLSNVYLKQLVQLTAKLLQKGTSGGGGPTVIPPSPLPPDNSIQGDMSGPAYTDSRSDFYGSAYSMHTPGVQA